MKDKVIFLDYDGVLNDVEYLYKFHNRPGTHFGKDSLDPTKISLLSNLCHLTGAKVVLTSAWRDDLATRKYLKSRWAIPIIGATPHKHDQRGLEIHQWLVDKHFSGQYIIIDDECSDLDNTQRGHLILTREYTDGYPVLGVQPKHLIWARAMFNQPTLETQANTEFINAILEAIENDWLRVMWNIHQEEYDDKNPWRNTGNVEGYKNDTFEVHAYDWGWDYDDKTSKPQPVNFKWRDLEITWYKWCGRGISTNRPVTHDELALMLNECIESLRKWENEHEQD